MGRYSVGTWLGLGALGVGESCEGAGPQGRELHLEAFLCSRVELLGGSGVGGEVGDAAFSLELFSP